MPFAHLKETEFLTGCCHPLAPLAPQVERGSLFPAACISLYTMYLAYSALQSEPRDYECNALGQRLSAASATTLATGVLLTLCSVVYSAFRAGSNTSTFRCGSASGGVRKPAPRGGGCVMLACLLPAARAGNPPLPELLMCSGGCYGCSTSEQATLWGSTGARGLESAETGVADALLRFPAQHAHPFPLAPLLPRSTGGFEEPLIASHSAAAADEGTSAGLDGVAPGAAAMERGSGGGAAAVEEPVTYNYTQVGTCRGRGGRRACARNTLTRLPSPTLCIPAWISARPEVPAPSCRSACLTARPAHSVASLPPQFYLVFALASMYIAMLMTGWGSQAGEAKVSRVSLPCHPQPAFGCLASCVGAEF